MPLFKCSYACDYSAYADFTIEAPSEAEAESKLNELLKRGCFDNVPAEVCYENGPDNERVFVTDEAESDDQPLLELEGFDPIPEARKSV